MEGSALRLVLEFEDNAFKCAGIDDDCPKEVGRASELLFPIEPNFCDEAIDLNILGLVPEEPSFRCLEVVLRIYLFRSVIFRTQAKSVEQTDDELVLTESYVKDCAISSSAIKLDASIFINRMV